ncbi:MAG: urease accessory protein UreD [Pseudomonadota bacterium]
MSAPKIKTTKNKENELPEGSTREGWRASIDLTLAGTKTGKTVVSYAKHVGPLRIQRPFYPEGDTPHLYLLHPPGGFVAGDELTVNVNVRENAGVLVTTPGASKVYRSLGDTSSVSNHIKVDGTLEWFPQETILFDQSRFSSQTTLHFGAQGRGFVWDIVCLGRPAGEFLYEKGNATLILSLETDQKLSFVDTLRLDPQSKMAKAFWGLKGQCVIGTMIAYPGDETLCQQTQLVLEDLPDTELTLLNNVLVVRALGTQAWDVRERFVRVWQTLRPLLLDRPVSIPRIWNT